MRIAVISVAPVFPNYVIGGSQKILADVAVGLKRSGHDVQIWCTGTAVYSGDFEINGVTVHPDLKLRGSFPATHQVSPSQIQRTTAVLRHAANWADRVYLHADAVYLRHAIEGAEIVRSIHDFVYEEALLSTLTLPAKTTIVPSEYLKHCVEATVALSGRTSIEPVLSVTNGVRIPVGESVPKLPSNVKAREANDLILLFPHRPGLTKGTKEAMLTAVEVQHRLPSRNVRLLMPTYPAGSQLDDAAGSRDEILRTSAELGARQIVELHGWLSPNEMSGYYAAGDVTLCLGSFVESFGLVAVESVVNGTPTVCARVGALRQFDDIDGISTVAYGEIMAAAESVLAAVDLNSVVLDSGRAQITDRYDYQQMINGYESVITGKLSPARSIEVPEGESLLRLAPWCDIQGDGIYDDYTAMNEPYPNLISALGSGEGSVQVTPSLLSDTLCAEVRQAKERGVVIPVFKFE